jgi:hypothetical protein
MCQSQLLTITAMAGCADRHAHVCRQLSSAAGAVPLLIACCAALAMLSFLRASPCGQTTP